jgi:hypothetical protein
MKTLVAAALLISVAHASKFVGPTEFVLEAEVTELHKQLPPDAQQQTVRWTVAAGRVAQAKWTRVVSVVDPWKAQPAESYLPPALYFNCTSCRVGDKLRLKLTRAPLVEGKLDIAGVIFNARRL